MKLKIFGLLFCLGIAVAAVGCGKSNEQQQNNVGASSPVVTAPINQVPIAGTTLPVGCYYGTSGTSCTNTCPQGFYATNGGCAPMTQSMPGYQVNPCAAYPGTFYNAWFNVCQPIGYSQCMYGTWSAYYQGCISTQYYQTQNNCKMKQILGGIGYMYYCL